jgi:hypothetical protein
MDARDLKLWGDACLSVAQECPRDESCLLLDMASAFFHAAHEADVEFVPMPQALMRAPAG